MLKHSLGLCLVVWGGVGGGNFFCCLFVLFYFIAAAVSYGRLVLFNCLASKVTDSKCHFDFILKMGACLCDFPDQ